MRVLVVSNLYPPVARGGYEVECSTVVEHLRARHDVLVLTSSLERRHHPREEGVWRELQFLTLDRRGALRAPAAAVSSVKIARRALAWQPDLVYTWNGSSIPQSALRVLADSGVPLAFRICEYWFARVFLADQYLRELLPASRGPARTVWSAGARTLNRLPSMRLEPLAPASAAISWGADVVRRRGGAPAWIEPVLERVQLSAPPRGDRYDAVVREPASDPEILFVGRVTLYKGVAVAIEALARLRSEHGVPATLVVMGPEDGAYGAEMRTLAARLGVANAIRWRGAGSPDDVAREYSRAHALILPSVWEEPQGMVAMEAALARVPIVASDVGGISEGVHHETHALLFERGDAAGAASALARTLSEREETAARVGRAYERAQEFRIAPYLEQQEDFITEACAILHERGAQRAGAGPAKRAVAAGKGSSSSRRYRYDPESDTAPASSSSGAAPESESS
jgi:glycogen(starch) synthase